MGFTQPGKHLLILKQDMNLTTVDVDGGADDDVGDGVDVDVADPAVLLYEGPQVAAVRVLKLLLHAPDQRLNAVMVLGDEMMNMSTRDHSHHTHTGWGWWSWTWVGLTLI